MKTKHKGYKATNIHNKVFRPNSRRVVSATRELDRLQEKLEAALGVSVALMRDNISLKARLRNSNIVNPENWQ